MIRGLLLLLTLVASLVAQSEYPPRLPDAEVHAYKTVGDTELNLWVYVPEGHQASDSRPAIVFFFGGGWRSGNPKQFVPHCKYLASRGMVAMVADYRVSERHGAKVVDCVEDAKSAVRWVRQHAASLGIDPDRIATGGGSAGGHLAAATGTIAKYDADSEDHTVSSVPGALVLYNPALVLAPYRGNEMRERVEKMKGRTGVDPAEVSPFHQVQAGAPPAIVFHGKADTTVPYRTAELFCEKSKRLGNRCELIGYDGAKHGFFNFGRDDGKAYYDTVRRMDEFLASLGWLKGAPTIQEP